MSTQMPLVKVSGSPNQTKSNDYGKGPGVEETELIVGEERQKTVLGKSDHSALSTLRKQSKTNWLKKKERNASFKDVQDVAAEQK